MPDDYDQINFRIDPERKDEWQQYVEDSTEFRYVSNLIRYAVQQQIDGSAQSSNGDSVPSNIEDQLEDMQEVLEEVATRNARMEDDIGNIKTEVTKDPELTDLANEVYEVLPDSKSSVKEYAEQAVGYDFKPGQVPQGPKPATISELSTVLEERELRIREAIQRLQKDTYLVASLVENETEYYYKND